MRHDKIKLRIQGTPEGSTGFTLIELLVVVSIIALLVTMLMPSLGKAMELTRRTVCATNLASLGRAWHVYFRDYNDKLPQKHNVNPGVCDVLSGFHFMIFCGTEHTTGVPDFINAGSLYKVKLIASERTYVCPTMQRNYGRPWFTKGKWPGAQNDPLNENPWPPLRAFGTYMTYGRRRMLNYDDPNLSDFRWNASRPRGDEHIMLYFTGASAVKDASGFSWMADRFDSPGWAMSSHVPGVNVLYFDSHVKYWPDPTWDEKLGTGKVLYDNGLGDWNDPNSNWYHDDIWMIIDGYHQPPVGQGT